MDAARQAEAEYEEPQPEYQPSPVHPLHRYAAPPAAASEQDHHEPQQDADEQHGLIKSVEQENARDPITILTPINAAMSKSRRRALAADGS